MAKHFVRGALVATLLTFAGAALAQEPTPVQKDRIAHFKQIGRASKAVRDELQKPAPDIAVLKTSAKAIDDLAGQLPTWFPAGSGEGGKTEALPAIWQKPAEFKKAADNFATQAHAFNAAAQTGSVDAVKAAAPQLGAACKACHDNFRAKEQH